MATLTTSGAVKLKAGKDVSEELTKEDYDQLIEEAESYIVSSIRIDVVDQYGNLETNAKKILDDAASCHAATSAIAYDITGYATRARAQTLLNVNWARLQENITLLEDKKTTDFLGAEKDG